MVASQPSETTVAAPGTTSLADRLSRNIAARRRALGLTQAQIAERLGVDTETLSRFERGKHLPSLATLERLAQVLATTIAELLSEEEKAVDDEALVVTTWLSALSPSDRDFAKTLLKHCCNYLSDRRSIVAPVRTDAEPD